MNAEQVIDTDKQHYMPVFARYPLVLTYGNGPYVYDAAGRKYLDFLAGIAVNIVGHAHPKLVEAISDQARKFIHVSNLYHTFPQTELVKALVELSGLDRVFIANSGAEANEGAIKLARKYAKGLSPDRVEIVTTDNSFHGRTLATLTATAQTKYQHGYEPLPQGFVYVPYNDLSAMERVVSEKTCAVLLEPIQGEGGVNIPDDGYLESVRRICDEHGALLILDEIQTGMGRTGKMFAFQHSAIKPDIITLAKGLGGGVPIGAFLAVEKVAGAFSPGDHGTTFGGNPLATAAANAVLNIIAEEGLIENTRTVGEHLVNALEQLKAKYPMLITEVRGRGLIVGMKLTQPGKDIVNACLAKGVIINCTAGDVLRFVPPLNIAKAHVDEMVQVLDSVLAEVR
ncbi:MAG: argD 1 [Firmicutes bacterium]|nr:argD 1 [Bacillota bacterium]